MKARWFFAVALLLVGTLSLAPATAHAKGKKGKSAIPASLLEKYDTDKDGKLSKSEQAKMTPEDLALMPVKKGKKAK